MAKQASSVFSVDVTGLNSAMGQPAYMRICERLRAAISSGALALNARLPSSRTLSKGLGVARSTVDEALSQLVADGYVVRRRGAGTFVACQLPERDLLPRSSKSLAKSKTATGQRRLSKRADDLKSYPGHYRSKQAIPFTPSLPPVNLFPRKIWNRLLSREAARPGDGYWSSCASNGLPALREAIAAQTSAMRATRCSPDQVIVVTSTQRAVEVDAKHVADGHNVLLTQGTLAAFIKEGHLARHLRKTRAIYDERRLAFLEEADILSAVLEFGPARAGMHVTGLFAGAADWCSGLRAPPAPPHGRAWRSCGGPLTPRSKLVLAACEHLDNTSVQPVHQRVPPARHTRAYGTGYQSNEPESLHRAHDHRMRLVSQRVSTDPLDIFAPEGLLVAGRAVRQRIRNSVSSMRSIDRLME